MLALGVFQWRRYALPLGLAGLLAVLHLVPGHKEYRFIFAPPLQWIVYTTTATPPVMAMRFLGSDPLIEVGRATG